MGTPAPATASTSPCTITNQTNLDLTVLQPQGVGNPDTVLTSANGNGIIKAGATATFNLDPNTVYDLIISRSDTLFPVANLALIADLNSGQFTNQTINQSNVQQMTDAFTFQQMITAFPGSQLATDYQAALGKANSSDPSAGTGTTSPDPVDAFFKATKNYQNVSGDAVTAVASYINQLPSVWAESRQSVTYYLYSNSNGTVAFAGTLALSTTAVDITRPNGGYNCVFSPASNGSDTTNVNVDSAKTKNLTYTNGLFVDDPKADIPNIALSGTFQLKSTLTQNPADSDIITALGGTIGGVKILGFDTPQESQDPNASFWQTLFHPQGSEQIFTSVMTLLGDIVTVLCMGQFVYGGIKSVRKKYTVERAKASKKAGAKGLDEVAQKAKADFEATKAKLSDQNVKSNQKLAHDSKVKVNTDPAKAHDSAVKASNQVKAQTDKVQLNKSLENQADAVKKLAAKEPLMTKAEIQNVQEAAKEVRASNQALNQAKPEDLPKVVETQKPLVENLHVKVESVAKNVGNKLAAREAAEVNKSIEVSKTAIQNQKAIDETENLKEPSAEEINPLEEIHGEI